MARQRLTPEQQAVKAAADRAMKRREPTPIDQAFVREAADRAEGIKVPFSDQRRQIAARAYRQTHLANAHLLTEGGDDKHDPRPRSGHHDGLRGRARR